MLIFLLACLMGLAAFSTSPLGGLLRRYLVELPARRLNAIRPGHVAMLVGLAIFGLIMFRLFDAEGLRVFGMMAPEIGVWFSTFELSLIMDALMLGAAIAATARLRDIGLLVRQAVNRLAAWLGRPFGARQPRTPSRPRRPEGSTADDPDPWGWTPVLA